MSVAVEPLVGCETPRLWTPPLRELTPATSAGFEAVVFAEDVLGMTLLPWQRWLLVHALELTDDGSAFRFRTVVVLVGRQNGKTTLSQVLSLWRMYVDGAALVIGTAQNLDVAEEAWQATVDLAEETPDLAAEIAGVDRTNGKKQLRLTSGERYKVAAASRRGGRGLSGELVLLDELREHQKWDAWAAVTKTTMARHRAQTWCTSNAGDASSVVLAHLRQQAHRELADGTAGSLGIFEWSAPDGCAVDDRDGWAQANPSLGWTITVDAIESAMQTDPEPVFRTEVLCQWVDQLAPTVLPYAAWMDCRDESSEPGETVALAVDVSWDRAAAWIALASMRDGVVHVEAIATDLGTEWVVPWLRERVPRLSPVGIAVQAGSSPAATLLAAMAEEDFAWLVRELSGTDMARAWGRFYDDVVGGRVRHIGQDVIDEQVMQATARTLGDGTVLDRRKSPVDVSGLVAVSAAHWLVADINDYDVNASIF